MFSSHLELEDHMQAEHIDRSPTFSPSFMDAYTCSSSIDNSQYDGDSSSGFLPTVGSPNLSAVLDRLTLPDNPMSSVGRLSERLILHVSDQSHIQDVSVLVLSDVGLSDFSSNTCFTVASMCNLVDLNLSYNYLTDLTELMSLPKLERLHLGHNLIVSVLPVKKLVNLKYLSMPHNQLTTLEGLEGLPMLSELNLAYNRLCDFDSTILVLRSLPVLESLLLSGNPVMGREPHMRYAVICQLQLRNLDAESVTNVDFDIALDVEMKRMFENDEHRPEGRHKDGFGAQELRKSGVAERLLQEIRKDRRFTTLIYKLNLKAKTVHTSDQAKALTVESLVSQMLHKLYSA